MQDPIQEDVHPAFIDKTLSQVSARPGELMAELASGAVVRVTDMRVPRVVGFVSMTRELPASLSVFAGMLPDPPVPPAREEVLVMHSPGVDDQGRPLEDAELAQAGRSA